MITNALDSVSLDSDIKTLHRILYTYVIGIPCKIDIWKIVIKVNQENGLINEIRKDQEKSMFEEFGSTFIKQFSKTFINYMSIGFDAKVGFNFEKKRSSCRCMNKCIYCWEAFKRYLLCKTNITLTNILESIQTFEPLPSDIKNINEHLEIIEDLFDQSKQEDLIHPFIIDKETTTKPFFDKPFFKSKVTSKSYPKGSVILKGDPIDLVCQNINFYFGGTRNIWEKSEHLGLKMIDVKDEDMRRYKQEIFENFDQQRFDDKKIEIFTYSSGVSMALENVSPGQASKIYQGKGPAIITFKKHPNEDEFAALNKVYLNVDGEFYHLLQPTEILIELNEDICNGQINFLKNEKGFI